MENSATIMQLRILKIGLRSVFGAVTGRKDFEADREALVVSVSGFEDVPPTLERADSLHEAGLDKGVENVQCPLLGDL